MVECKGRVVLFVSRNVCNCEELSESTAVDPLVLTDELNRILKLSHINETISMHQTNKTEKKENTPIRERNSSAWKNDGQSQMARLFAKTVERKIK